MDSNVKQAVPFFMVKDILLSIDFYEKIGFTMTTKWVDDGKLKWCWLQFEGAAMMLQEYPANKIPQIKTGEGVTICFQCVDALMIYQNIISKAIESAEPFVGNNMWVISLKDLDGYRLEFESPTDVEEETKYFDWKKQFPN